MINNAGSGSGGAGGGCGDGKSGIPNNANNTSNTATPSNGHHQLLRGTNGTNNTFQQQTTSSGKGGGNDPPNQRFSSLIHDSEVFLTKLREFKPQSLGCLEARRKSSSTLIFPSPQQACMGQPKCPRYPHNVKPTPGYWIECHGPGANSAQSGKGIVTTQAGAVIQAHHQQANQEVATSSSSSRQHDDSRGSHHHMRSSPFSISSNSEHQQFDLPTGTTTTTIIPTTPTAERIITRHGNDLGLSSHYDESKTTTTNVVQNILGTEAVVAATVRRSNSIERLESLDLIESSTKQLSDMQLESNITSNAQNQFSNRQNSIRTTPSYDDQHHFDTPAINETSSFQTKSEIDQRASFASNISAQSKIIAQDARKKQLNKRTMTRDDIDLHKTRRGTPNITITEPSFNQSITIAYNQQQPLAVQQKSGPIRQGSQGFDLKLTNSSVDQSDSESKQQQQQQPIKFQIQRYMSIEAQQSKDEQLGAPTKTRDFIIERQENTETDDLISTSPPYDITSTPYQHHRPSIICEDVDNEISETIGGFTDEIAPIVTTNLPSSTIGQEQQKEFYCGLSTTTFNKRPYQQSYSEPQNLDQFRDSSLELISFEEENYEKHYYGREHWNYFTNDELLGPVMLSLKQEVNNQRDHFHVLLRTVSYTLHGTIPASTICADRYDREAIVRELSEIAKLKPPLMLGQLPSTPDELLKLDHIFIKTELKVGVIYIKAGQEESEEAILSNKEESLLFKEFLDLLGDRITLKGFDRYKGGLDTVHNLTGTESVYTMWRNIEIMFHVSTMLPHEENDPQKLQKKRHIGNDIVCVAFVESDETLFWPGCIKSYFLHTFIAVQTSPKPLQEGEKRKYHVTCVCRNEVQYAFKPYLVEQDDFFKSDYFREWLLVKIVNGERASYSAPKFARMQDRTRSQLLEDIITNLANHLVTGQIPKPYRRGSWRPLGHTRASSPLEDSMKDYFEDYDQLAKDFCNAFCGPNKSVLCDVIFRVKDTDGSYKLVHGVRAIMAIRSRTFLEMLYGFVPPGTGPTSLQNQTNLRAIEMKALSGESSAGASGKDFEQTKTMLAKRGSVGTDSSRKTGEKERRQSMLPNLSKSISQKPNYLTVPNTSGGAGGASSGGSTSGMIKNAFNRLVSGNWSGWSGNIKGYKGEPMHIKVDQNKTKVDLNSLAICKEIAKIDADKLTQREFEIKEFDYETFQQTIEYIHNGQCKLSYETIPGLICAAEHYDLPDLLHACFHHANTHMRLSAAPKMMNALYQNSCFYITAMQLLDSIYEYIDPHGNEFFSRTEYLDLYESVFTTLLSRKSLQVDELTKFQSMHGWTRQQVLNKWRQKQVQRKPSSQTNTDHEKSNFDIIESRATSTTATAANPSTQQSTTTPTAQSNVVSAAVATEPDDVLSEEWAENDYKNLMHRLNKDINIKLDKISNEDLVKVVLPTKVFNNDKIFEIMSDESRIDY